MNIKSTNLSLVLDTLTFKRSKKEITNKAFILIITHLILKLNSKIKKYKNKKYKNKKQRQLYINYDFY